MTGDADLLIPSKPGLHVLLDGPQTRGSPLAPLVAGEMLDRGHPVINLLLDEAAPQFRSHLNRLEVPVDDAEEDGRLTYVDAHAPQVGWAHTTPQTVFAETPEADALLLGLSEAQAGVVEQAPEHAVVVSSLSSLLVTRGLNEAYRFGQSIASMAPRMGAIVVARVVQGMHDERETTALRHLATTVTDVSQTPTPDTDRPTTQPEPDRDGGWPTR